MYSLYLKLSANPRLLDAYEGALPCSMLAALLVEDDEAVTAAVHFGHAVLPQAPRTAPVDR